MQTLTAKATFAGSTILLSTLFPTVDKATKIYVEPATANTHNCAVTDASGNVIRELAATTATATAKADSWELDAHEFNMIELAQYGVSGTSTEAARVSISVA